VPPRNPAPQSGPASRRGRRWTNDTPDCALVTPCRAPMMEARAFRGLPGARCRSGGPQGPGRPVGLTPKGAPWVNPLLRAAGIVPR
jgi:hypothetical protein